MNGIALNLLPNDEQLDCDHVIGLLCEGEKGFSIAHPKDADRMKKYGGLGAAFCMICGARLEDA